MTPSFAPVAVSVNCVAVTDDITKLPLAFEESAPNVVTSLVPTNVLAPPASAAGLRQYAAAVDAILFTSWSSASLSAVDRACSEHVDSYHYGDSDDYSTEYDKQ